MGNLMNNDYYINLEEYSLQKFKNELKESELLPSRKILKDKIEERFKVLEDNGISNLQELIDSLKTPKKAKEFSQKSGMPSEYLLILRREANSYLPKPVSLEKFPEVKNQTIEKLNGLGIKNTSEWYEYNKSGKRPSDIPTNPQIVYKKEWRDWGDWLRGEEILEQQIENLDHIKMHENLCTH